MTSRARGEDRPRDLDVGVVFEHGVRPDVLGLVADLTDLAAADVDPAHLDRARAVLREAVAEARPPAGRPRP